jgi:uncharacterized membrane protein (UPF0127 family)
LTQEPVRVIRFLGRLSGAAGEVKMTVGRLRTVKVIAGLLLAALLGLGGWARGQEVSPYGNPWVWVNVGRVTVQAEAVRTPARLYLGLSNRRSLPEGQGMLFLMPEKEVQTFCMRGMRFPLDFIWISQGRVAGITRNVPPTFTGDLKSPGPVGEVLEVPGGFAQKYGVSVGDRVRWW